MRKSVSCCPLPQRLFTSCGQRTRSAAAMPVPAAVSELAKADAAKNQYIILAECGPSLSAPVLKQATASDTSVATS